MHYQIFTDATSDINETLLQPPLSVEIVPMHFEIEGKEYEFHPLSDFSVKAFYTQQREGHYATTSCINPFTYRQSFEPYLKNEIDVLYLCFSSGMSSTIQAANQCIHQLREEYPERRIVCIDTLCGSVGEGFLVIEAARKQSEGLSMIELEEWVLDHRLQVCHWFSVDTFDHLLYGGRVSPTTAMLGSALHIKPLLHVDTNGCLQLKEKNRGHKKAIAAQVGKILKGWRPDIGNLVVVGHGDAPEAADELAKAVAERFPGADLRIVDMGPIIGAHTGPGVVALIYWGNNR